MHYQERSCAGQKLDETDTERCVGRDELGRLWHAVADGGSRIEVDEEGHSRTFCLRTLKLTDTREAAPVVQRLHRMKKRQSHIMTNADNESERSLREP